MIIEEYNKRFEQLSAIQDPAARVIAQQTLFAEYWLASADASVESLRGKVSAQDISDFERYSHSAADKLKEMILKSQATPLTPNADRL